MNKELKQEFESVVQKYAAEFCQRMYGEACNPDDFWIGGDIGGVLNVGDEYWSFDQIRKTIDNDYDPKDVFAWYDYCLRLHTIDATIMLPTLEHWMNGYNKIPEERIQQLEEQSRILRMSIEDLKNDINVSVVPEAGKESECEQ